MVEESTLSFSRSPSIHSPSTLIHGRRNSNRCVSPQSTRSLNIEVVPGEMTSQIDANKCKRMARHRTRHDHMEVNSPKRKSRGQRPLKRG